MSNTQMKPQGPHEKSYSERTALLHKALLDTTVKGYGWCEFWKLSPSLCPSYVAFLKDYITTLDHSTQVAYYHFLKGIPQDKTSLYLQLSQDQIEALLEHIFENLPDFFAEVQSDYSKDDKVLQDFYELLLDSNISDGDISALYHEEIEVIKIIRIFAKETKNSCKKNCENCTAKSDSYVI